MDIKHIEELAKDKDLLYGLIVSSFMQYDVDAFDWKFVGYPKPKCYKDLTNEEKEFLINKAYKYWLDADNVEIGLVCDCVMGFQKDVLNGTMSKYSFLDKLYLMI